MMRRCVACGQQKAKNELQLLYGMFVIIIMIVVHAAVPGIRRILNAVVMKRFVRRGN